MSDRRLWLILLLAMLLLTLTSCGPRRLSPQAYQDLVIKTLQGGEWEKGGPPLPGLIPSIKKLFGSLYCAESNCGVASEMQYIVETAKDEVEVVAEYHGRICNKKVRPPKDMQATQEEICSLLDGIGRDADAMSITAGYAARILAGYGNSADLGGFSQKIMERKGMIIEALRKLREISWLAPVFQGVKDEIPELGRK